MTDINRIIAAIMLAAGGICICAWGLVDSLFAHDGLGGFLSLTMGGMFLFMSYGIVRKP